MYGPRVMPVTGAGSLMILSVSIELYPLLILTAGFFIIVGAFSFYRLRCNEKDD